MPPFLPALVFIDAIPVRSVPPPKHAGKSSVVYAVSPLPAPRAVIQIPGWIPGESAFDGLRAATPQTLVIQLTNRRDERVNTRIVALNRGRQNVAWTKEAERIDLRAESIQAVRLVLGSGSDTKSPPVIVVQRQIWFSKPDGSRYETEWYGLDEASRIVWQYPPAKEPAETKKYVEGAPLVGNLLFLRAYGSDALILWDAQTGKLIDKAAPEGKAAIVNAIQTVGSPLLQAWDKLYRLDTGVTLPIPYKVNANSDEQVVPLGITSDRAIWRAGGDDGGMGHSSWPTYLIASDENGKLLWHFPTAKESDYLNGGIDAPSASSVTLVGGMGSEAIAVVPTNGKNGGLYGLRVRDGKPLWKRALPDISAVAAQSQTASNVFVLRVRCNAPARRYENSVLEYLNAATGKTQKAWRLPASVRQIAIAGDDLLTIDESGKVAIYSCPALIK